MLAIIEHQQELAMAQVIEHGVAGRSLRGLSTPRVVAIVCATRSDAESGARSTSHTPTPLMSNFDPTNVGYRP